MVVAAETSFRKPAMCCQGMPASESDDDFDRHGMISAPIASKLCGPAAES